MTDVYLEVGLQDGIRRRRGFSAENRLGDEKRFVQQKRTALPENLMEELSQYLGDGNAKVVVGAELTHSRDYGCKAGAFVSISVHCNADSQTIQEVHDTLMPVVHDLTRQDLAEAIKSRDDFMDHGVEPRVVGSPPTLPARPAARPNMPAFRR
jgi:hypothetical protein